MLGERGAASGRVEAEQRAAEIGVVSEGRIAPRRSVISKYYLCQGRTGTGGHKILSLSGIVRETRAADVQQKRGVHRDGERARARVEYDLAHVCIIREQ